MSTTSSLHTWLLCSAVILGACRTAPDKTDEGADGLTGEEDLDADGDGIPADEDCDDGDASVGPGAVEVCDGVDNDCDGEVDNGVTTAFYTDADGDGFGDGSTEVLRCAAEEGEVAVAGDCDDADSTVHPDATEACDEQDNDCDGEIDEGATETFYTDADNDGYGDLPVEACTLGDGLSPVDGDCDDLDPAVNPDAAEVCNERDDNCDGATDEGVTTTYYADVDSDGYGDLDATTEACALPPGYSETAGDCDDGDGAVNPAATELCNSVDDDCDGATDEEDAADAPTWYSDLDMDGYGDPANSTVSCALPPGMTDNPDDCDDGDSAVNPGATEQCNSIDDDCDGAVDDDDASLDLSSATSWHDDDDGDGYGDPTTAVTQCTAPAGSVSDDTDCDDLDAAVNPAATEVCNGVDDDCDGAADDDDSSVDLSTGETFYTDADGDGYGTASTTTLACDAPSGTVTDNTDCDDSNSAVNPAATEVCNSIDDDCDGATDDDDLGLDTSTGTTFYADDDLDGYGDASETEARCAAGDGYIADNTDCDDTDPDTYPGADEPCSGGDRDCDGTEPDTCASCLEVLDDGASVGDGLYTLDPDGPGGLSEVETWCDMSTDGGGWTLVQRTVWDWSDSSQLQTAYATWYGSTLGDPSAGNAFRMAGRYWTHLNSETDHMLLHVPRDASSGADCGELVYVGTGGSYSISSSTTTLSAITSTVTFANTTTLSSTDAGPSSACVNGYDAVNWFYTSCCTTCPTFQGSYWSDEAHPMASYLSSTPDEFGNLDADVCASGAAVTSYGYEGVNVMEYYLR
jgi:hypothetical protein